MPTIIAILKLNLMLFALLVKFLVIVFRATPIYNPCCGANPCEVSRCFSALTSPVRSVHAIGTGIFPSPVVAKHNDELAETIDDIAAGTDKHCLVCKGWTFGNTLFVVFDEVLCSRTQSIEFTDDDFYIDNWQRLFCFPQSVVRWSLPRHIWRNNLQFVTAQIVLR